MLGAMADIRAKFQDQVLRERDERERSEETMINLLEQTCNKLNQVKYEV